MTSNRDARSKRRCIALGLALITTFSTSGCSASLPAQTVSGSPEKQTKAPMKSTITINLPEKTLSLYILPVNSVPIEVQGLAIAAVKHQITSPQRVMILEKCLSNSSIQLKTIGRNELPPYPMEMLTACGSTKEQLATLNNTKNFIRISLEDSPTIWPPYNEVAVRMVAGALAAELKTFTVDLVALSTRTAEAALQIQSDNKLPTMAEFVKVIQSDNKNGRWMTTNGLQRFGLPELQVVDVAPQISDNMAYLMIGLAWKILKEHHDTKTSKLLLASPVTLTRADISEAYGEETKNGKNSAPVYLCLDKGDRDSETYLTIRAPEGEEKPFNQYLTELCSTIFGESSDRTALSQRSKAMEEAMKSARDELPSVRNRFLSGKLPKRSQLMVKFGVGGKRKEYLWASITDWSDETKPRGYCGNNAVEGSDLKAGQPLTLDSDSIVDWAVMINDDIVEGARTNKVLEKEAESEPANN